MAVISIRKRYPGQARRVMMGLWGMLPQFNYTKTIIVVDDDIDVRNWNDVPWALATRMDPSRDLLPSSRTRRSTISISPRPSPGSAASSASTRPTRSAPRRTREWGRDARHVARGRRNASTRSGPGSAARSRRGGPLSACGWERRDVAVAGGAFVTSGTPAIDVLLPFKIVPWTPQLGGEADLARNRAFALSRRSRSLQ